MSGEEGVRWGNHTAQCKPTVSPSPMASQLLSLHPKTLSKETSQRVQSVNYGQEYVHWDCWILVIHSFNNYLLSAPRGYMMISAA